MRNSLAALLLSLSLFSIAAAQTGAVKLEGQVVCCADCWAEADRTKVEFGTAEDLLKAKSCVEGGDPTLLAVREGDKFTLYRLDQGKFRLAGKNWLEYVGKRVAVTGSIHQKKDAGAIRVDALEVIAVSLAEREAANVLGQEVELTLKDPFGAEQRLSALKGRIVVLNFWATYCVPCRKEMPDSGHRSIGGRGGRPRQSFAVRQRDEGKFPRLDGGDHGRHDALRSGRGVARNGHHRQRRARCQSHIRDRQPNRPQETDRDDARRGRKDGDGRTQANSFR
jgi:hypothetical protein